MDFTTAGLLRLIFGFSNNDDMFNDQEWIFGYLECSFVFAVCALREILMAVDDSQSMMDCGAGAPALAAMATIASSMTQLEAGHTVVARDVIDNHTSDSVVVLPGLWKLTRGSCFICANFADCEIESRSWSRLELRLLKCIAATAPP